MSHASPLVSEVTLVKRINRALSDSGLRVRIDPRRSLKSALSGRHQIVYGARAFPLRVGLEELASSLGIMV